MRGAAVLLAVWLVGCGGSDGEEAANPEATGGKTEATGGKATATGGAESTGGEASTGGAGGSAPTTVDTWETCSSADDCEAGSLCAPLTEGSSETACAPACDVDTGSFFQVQGDLASACADLGGECTTGLVEGRSICVPPAPLKTLGEPCGSADECEAGTSTTGQVMDAVCVQPGPGQEKVCLWGCDDGPPFAVTDDRFKRCEDDLGGTCTYGLSNTRTLCVP